MPNTPYQSDRARAMWKSCLASAFRSALACTIVGCATLYGPASLRLQVAFPAFSYVTVILVVTDATLGDTLLGCWHALYASVLVICPAILSLWAIGPARFTTGTTSFAVALSSFVVALPENTHLISKRIALGQIVIVYVIGYINGVHTEAIMHPVHVAASTAIGVLACVLALLVPYPSLACCEVKQNCKLFADNALERLNLFVKAFYAEDKTSTQPCIMQAKSLAVTGTKLLQSIKSKQESMQWERLPIKFLKPYCMNPGDRLPELETPLRGMNIALTTCTDSNSFGTLLDQELKSGVLKIKDQIEQTLDQIRICLPVDSSTVPESNSDNLIKSLQTLQNIPQTQKNLPSFFFLFCLKLLHNKSMSTTSSSIASSSKKQEKSLFKEILTNLTIKLIKKRLIPAFRCSISLGFAVLFGLMYSKENGFWAGLPVAISFASSREATFKVANLKAQGTVLGTVYGVLGCFLFEKYLPIRFISLLPWFIFTSFLRRSRMYSQAGGISAVIGAVLILGRKDFGPPSDFAIARIVETFIGLSCSIMVDLLFLPTRASKLAKIQISESLGALHECVGSISLRAGKAKLEESQTRLKFHVNELKIFIGEAEVEPNFWFLPFHSACYGKLFLSLSKMVDLFLFSAQAIGFIEQESQKRGLLCKESVEKLDGDLEILKEMVSSSIKCFEEVTLIKSLTFLEKELQNKDISIDVELGKSRNSRILRGCDNSDEDHEIEKIMSSYLQHSKEVIEKVGGVVESENEVKSQLVLSLSTLAFCMSNVMKETREIEKGIKELVQWENSSSQVNLCDISCKIQALNNYR